MPKYVIATTDEISPGTSRIVTVRNREIGVFNVGGEYFALFNRCPHEGAALCKGRITGRMESDKPGEYRLTHQGEMLRCPWHGWEFDIRTGQSWCDPEHTYVRSFKAHVEPGASLVKGPYVAETVPVRVEGNYVVVEM